MRKPSRDFARFGVNYPPEFQPTITGLADALPVFAHLGERAAGPVEVLLGGNGNGHLGNIGHNGDNNGNGNGKKGLPPPALVDDAQTFVVNGNSITAVLTQGEEAYLKLFAPSRNLPPFNVTAAELMEAASVIARVSPYPSMHHQGDEALAKYKQKLELLDKAMDDIGAKMGGYEGRALRRIKKALTVLGMQYNFLQSATRRLEAFKTNLELYMAEQNEARNAINAALERELKAADDYIMPRAVETLLEKVALGAVTLGTAGSIAGSVLGVFAADVLMPAAIASAAFLGGKWLLGKQKQRMKDAIERKYNGQLRKNGETVMEDFRLRMGELALDLITMVRDAYPKDWARQYEAIGTRIRANLAVETGLPEANGYGNSYKADREIADSLIEALMTQKV